MNSEPSEGMNIESAVMKGNHSMSFILRNCGNEGSFSWYTLAICDGYSISLVIY
jgi:hypothetical protein